MIEGVMSWNQAVPFTLLYGHTPMQTLQDERFILQKSKHFLPSTGHLTTPGRLDMLSVSAVCSPELIQPLGQFSVTFFADIAECFNAHIHRLIWHQRCVGKYGT